MILENGIAIDKSGIGTLMHIEFKDNKLKTISPSSEKYDMFYEGLKQKIYEQKMMQWGEGLPNYTEEYEGAFF